MTTIKEEDILKRKEEWTARLQELYKMVRQWLENSEYTLEEGNPVTFRNIDKKIYEIDEPLSLPVLDIYRDEVLVASLKPRGLWTIGANGRVDLLNRTYRVIIFDKSESDQPPKWEILDGTENNSRERLDKEIFIEILNKL